MRTYNRLLGTSIIDWVDKVLSAVGVRGKKPPPRVPRVYYIGGSWGAHVEWMNPEHFQEISKHNTFTCWGHYTPLPQVGDILIGDFQRSVITFTFVNVEPCTDPSDMFFADVVPTKQELKDG